MQHDLPNIHIVGRAKAAVAGLDISLGQVYINPDHIQAGMPQYPLQ